MSNGIPAITAGSLDGFIVGALVTVACFLAIVIPWRARKRRAEAADLIPPAADVVAEAWDPAALAEDPAAVTEDPIGPRPVLSAAGPAAMGDRLRSADVDSARHDAAAREQLAAVSSARRWQEAAAARYDREREHTAARAGEPSAPRPRTGEPSALDGDNAAPADDNPDQRGRQGRPGGHRAPHPLGDPTFDDAAAGMPRPPGARHLPRHAAPTPSLGDKMTGVFASRSVGSRD